MSLCTPGRTQTTVNWGNGSMLSIHVQPHECIVCYHNYCNKINSSESYSPLMIAAWVSEVWLTLSILGSCLLPRKVIFGPIPIMDPYLITKYGKMQGQLTPKPSILQVHQFLFFIIIRSTRNQSVWGEVWLWGKRVYSCVDVRVLVYYVHVSMSSVHSHFQLSLCSITNLQFVKP